LRSRFWIVLVALLHAYIGLRLLPDLPLDLFGRAAGAILLTVSALLLPRGFAGPREEHTVESFLMWAGLIAMGLFSSLLVFTLLRDVVLTLSLYWLSPRTGHELIEVSAIAVPALALFASAVGFLNARRSARVVEVEVPLAELPPALSGFTIAQISDVHVGPTIKRNYLAAIVAKVNALSPDLIAVTGDLVDGSVAQLRPHTEPLSKLRARHGAYFVTGNHEYYSGERAWTRELRRLGLKVLKNEHVVVRHEGAELVLAGVTDFSAHHFEPAERSDPKAALAGAPATPPKVLLAHQPRSAAAAAAAGFDLQLSGHTHGGQFWPWNHFVRFQQPFTAGLNRLNRLWVYVSRGTGYWGPPKRFGAPSEITLIRLVPA
jgi:predicted MPP superfamily phosphohydrolase